MAAGIFLEGEDEGFAVVFADAFVAVSDIGVEKDGVAVFEIVRSGRRG